MYVMRNSRLRSDEQYVRYSAEEGLVETDPGLLHAGTGVEHGAKFSATVARGLASVGVEQLTTFKYVVRGKGTIRAKM